MDKFFELEGILFKDGSTPPVYTGDTFKLITVDDKIYEPTEHGPLYNFVIDDHEIVELICENNYEYITIKTTSEDHYGAITYIYPNPDYGHGSDDEYLYGLMLPGTLSLNQVKKKYEGIAFQVGIDSDGSYRSLSLVRISVDTSYLGLYVTWESLI